MVSWRSSARGCCCSVRDGETKRTFESALDWYGRAYGFRAVSLRYFNVAGATERVGEVHDPETHLIPTILDMPPVKVDVLELADPGAPYGLRGIGEPPNISTPPAIVAALRDATGRELPRMPVRPEQIVGIAEGRSAG